MKRDKSLDSRRILTSTIAQISFWTDNIISSNFVEPDIKTTQCALKIRDSVPTENDTSGQD